MQTNVERTRRSQISFADGFRWRGRALTRHSHLTSSPPPAALLSPAAEPGDPQVEWDEWEPEVYSAEFGPGPSRQED